ncbi:MAG: hypothetical protein HY547_06840 [Elusimicrobia bacterium]|nr:hypothetical protein [Elusimicrobiota bacterium]
MKKIANCALRVARSKKIGFLVFLFLTLNSPLATRNFLYGIDSAVGYDYGNLSFYSPSRAWRLWMQDRTDTGSDFVEYIRTHRFEHWDNTFNAGYGGQERGLRWEVKFGATPKADTMYRNMVGTTLFLPSPGYQVEPFVHGDYRRYTGAKLTASEAGLRGTVGKTLDATVSWGRLSTTRLGDINVKNSAGTTSQRLGMHWTPAIYIFGLRLKRKEFFDPGNPYDPQDYEVDEHGGGINWMLDQGVQLQGTYVIEDRSNGTWIKKYGITYQQAY